MKVELSVPHENTSIHKTNNYRENGSPCLSHQIPGKYLHGVPLILTENDGIVIHTMTSLTKSAGNPKASNNASKNSSSQYHRFYVYQSSVELVEICDFAHNVSLVDEQASYYP